VKTLIGFALGTLLSLGAVTSAAANGGAPAQVPAAGIEVIVVTAKRPAAPPVAAAVPIEEFIVIGKRVATVPQRTPPAMTIEMPKLELAIAAPPVIRL
jgi:hypothetical protein